MEAPAVAPVGQVVAAEKIGDKLNAIQDKLTGFTTKAKEDTKNKIAEHKELMKGEISKLGIDITGKVKGIKDSINLRGLFSKGAAAGGRRTRRRKSSRKGKGKRKSKKNKKNKSSRKGRSKLVRFSLRRR